MDFYPCTKEQIEATRARQHEQREANQARWAETTAALRAAGLERWK